MFELKWDSLNKSWLFSSSYLSTAFSNSKRRMTLSPLTYFGTMADIKTASPKLNRDHVVTPLTFISGHILEERGGPAT